MYCPTHPSEKIICLNINPNIKNNQLICFDCYIELISQKVPQKYLVKIKEVRFQIYQILKNPKLLFISHDFSVPNQRIGYDKFIIVEKLLQRQADILKVNIIQLQQISDINEVVEGTLKTLSRWLDQYTYDVLSVWQEAQQLEDYVWDKINYTQAERNLKQILVDQSNNKQIIDNIDKMFQDMNVDDNPEFNQKFAELCVKESEQKNSVLIDVWKIHLRTLHTALQNLIDMHDQGYASAINL